MDRALQFHIVMLWVVLIFNLFITMTLVRRINTINNRFNYQPELVIGSEAPNFKAETLERQKVTKLTYNNQKVLFVFISPHCSLCREDIPMLETLGSVIKINSHINLIFVSEGNLGDTQSLVNELNIRLPVLVAPRNFNKFARDYNPQGLNPYYCLVNAQGMVESRGRLHMTEWMSLQREWLSKDQNQLSPMARRMEHYT